MVLTVFFCMNCEQAKTSEQDSESCPTCGEVMKAGGLIEWK